MNTYETVFIMNPVLSDEQIKETVKKFVGYIKKKKVQFLMKKTGDLKN